MTVSLFPRLDALGVEQCLRSLNERIRDADLPLTEDRLPAATGWTAIGGGQISMTTLADLRSLLVRTARECGFPGRGSVADRARFDSLATGVLAGFSPLASGEADRDDVWAFIATVLVPDIVAWRFVNRSADRFEGGVRNAFQRLWMRAWALDRGGDAGDQRWQLVEILTEDAMVQLTERPSIGADRSLSLAIANAWAATAERVGTGSMQEVMRKAIVDLRIRNEIQMLASLGTDVLQSHVDTIFAKAAGLEIPGETGSPPAQDDDGGESVMADGPEPAGKEQGMPVTGSGNAKTGELEIQHAILELMLDRKVWSNGELKARLACILPLTETDRGTGARSAEQLWENRVNNALGRARASSLYSKGFVENRGHGLHAITSKGVAYITDDVDLDQLADEFAADPRKVDSAVAGETPEA